MDSGRYRDSVIAGGINRRASGAAASALLLAVALAGCVPSDSGSSGTASSSPPSSSPSSSSTPMPTPDPLVIPGCDTLLPLTDARDLFSPNTEVLATEDTVPPRGDPPEFDVAASNATIAKNCIWGLPRSDGGFTLAVTDISEADAESLTTALVAAGFMGETVNEITELELTSENMVGTASDLHYFVADLWIYVNATSADLAVDVADRALDAVRAANPTRTY